MATLDDCRWSPHAVHEFVPYVAATHTTKDDYVNVSNNEIWLVCKWCRAITNVGEIIS